MTILHTCSPCEQPDHRHCVQLLTRESGSDLVVETHWHVRLHEGAIRDADDWDADTCEVSPRFGKVWGLQLSGGDADSIDIEAIPEAVRVAASGADEVVRAWMLGEEI